MTIPIRPSDRVLTDGVFDFLRQLEQARNEFNPSIHDYGLGVPTLGYGYSLLVKRADDDWVEKDELDADLLLVGIVLDEEQRLILDEIRQLLNLNTEAGRNAAGALVPQLALNTQPIFP